MTIRSIILGLLTFLAGCSRNENADKDVIKSDNGIITFDDFKQEHFKDGKTFELFQEAIKETKNGNFELARTLLERAIILDPKNKIIHSSLGSTELELKNYDAGIHHLKNAYDLDSTYLEACTNMAIGYNALKEYEKAIEICDFAIEKSKRRKVLCAANYNKSIAEYEMKNLDKAISDINKAIEFSDNESLRTIFDEIRSGWLSERDLQKVLNGGA